MANPRRRPRRYLRSGSSVDRLRPPCWAVLDRVAFLVGAPKNLKQQSSERVRIADHTHEPLTGKWISHLAKRLPLNEITHLFSNSQDSATRERVSDRLATIDYRSHERYPFHWPTHAGFLSLCGRTHASSGARCAGNHRGTSSTKIIVWTGSRRS